MTPTTIPAADAARVFTQTLASALNTTGMHQIQKARLDMEQLNIGLMSETAEWEARDVVTAAKAMAHAITEKGLRVFWRLPLPGGLEGFACDASVVPVRVLCVPFNDEHGHPRSELWFDVVGGPQ